MTGLLLMACSVSEPPVETHAADDPSPPVTGETDTERSGHTGDTGADPADTAAPVTWVQVDVGGQFSCGLMSNGVARCWGYRECEDGGPPPTATFTQIWVEGAAFCGIQTDGTLGCWCCTDDIADTYVCEDTPNGQPYERVSVGCYDACAQDARGVLDCWTHQIRDGVPLEPVGEFQVESTYAAAILADGTVYPWGYYIPWTEPPPVAVAFTDIGLGRGHACGIDANGTGYCWGIDMAGDPFPDAPPGPWVRVESFNQVTCFVDAADMATCIWGYDIYALELWETQMAKVPYAHLGLGEWDGCGVDLAGQATCWGGDPSFEVWLDVPELP